MRDDIIRMAREAGIIHPEMVDKTLERFYNLAVQHEREMCAQICEKHPDGLNMMGGAFVTCAVAIRARGAQE